MKNVEKKPNISLSQLKNSDCTIICNRTIEQNHSLSQDQLLFFLKKKRISFSYLFPQKKAALRSITPKSSQ